MPSGASTGVHEALEMRDGDASRYKGLGVLKAVEHVNTEIAAAVVGTEFSQESLDAALIALDGTPNKSRLGANAILGVSLAFARATALERGLELYQHLGSLVGATEFALPQPMLNIINGGKHADSGLDVQEFMLAPTKFETFERKIQAGAEVIGSLKKLLSTKSYAVSVGDEGGFAPKLSSNEEAFDLIIQAVRDAGYMTEQVQVGMDAAASSFYTDAMYTLKIEGAKQSLNGAGMISWYQSLVQKYPLILIEDGLAEDDWDGFTALTQTLGDTVRVVGDDLLVTNIARIKTAIEKKAVNSVLIKLNQIGTLTETIAAIQLTKAQGWAPFVSHRSGETTDTFIADLAVGLSCPFIKSGSLVRGERVCKYNRLVEIERHLARA